MIVNFSAINQKEQPVLVLRNIDGTAIQTLGFAFNIEGELHFNETSVLTFDVPAFANGSPTPHYDDIVGMRIIELVGCGQFILVDPETENNGVSEIKHCKAYSLEYELTYKQMTLQEGVYKFYDIVNPDETFLGIVLSYLPSWKPGTIDPTIAIKYRSLDGGSSNVYNYLKSDAQKRFGCIFDFDTYNREINVISVDAFIATKPIYLSLENLLDNVNVSEDTENIFTVLDVNGADGVYIYPVNPTGTNKIYNLDYYMNNGHFSDDLVLKWEHWKKTYEGNLDIYYNKIIERMILTSQIILEQENLRKLKEEELTSQKNARAVTLTALAQYKEGTTSHTKLKESLAAIDTKILEIEGKITTQQGVVDGLNAEKSSKTEEIEAINQETSFSNEEFEFTKEDLLVLDRYFKESAIEDSDFVLSPVDAYTDNSRSENGLSGEIKIIGGTTSVTNAVTDKLIYTIEGGSLSFGCFEKATVSRVSVEAKSDDTFVLVGYFSDGTYVADTNGKQDAFGKGCVTLCGNYSSASKTIEINGAVEKVETTEDMSFTVSDVRLYFTHDTTEYEEFSVSWDLFKYGRDCLRKLSSPAYTFKISCANFLTLDAFKHFASQLELGKKIYIELRDGLVLQPVLVKVELRYEDPSSLELTFGDTFSAAESKFSLVDLLEQSISMGKTVDAGKLKYSSFVDSGASSDVRTFMESSLDVSKNSILSGEDMAIDWDTTGLHLRKWNDNKTGYEDEQIAMINNSIVFTEDGWQSAKMAIGKFYDENYKNGTEALWGIVAPYLVGTILAGENLVIETPKDNNGKMSFRVDGDGASLYNAPFELSNGKTHILLDPELGFGIGANSIVSLGEGNSRSWNETNTKFWVDVNGDLHLKGELHGATGSFTGTVSSGSGDNYTAMNGTNDGTNDYSTYAFWAGAENPNNAEFWVMKNGNMKASSGTFGGIVQATDYQIKKGDAYVSMFQNNQWQSDYLNLKGLTVYNNENQKTFEITSDGDVYVDGDITMSAGSGITWDAIMGVTDEDNVSVEEYIYGAYDTAALTDKNIERLAYGEKLVDSNGNEIITDIKDKDGNLIKSTFISGTTIKAPTIIGGTIKAHEFRVYPEDEYTGNGDFTIYGRYDDVVREFFSIKYFQADVPIVDIYSPAGAQLRIGSNNYIEVDGHITFKNDKNVIFSGSDVMYTYGNVTFSSSNVDFTTANVIGLGVCRFG